MEPSLQLQVHPDRLVAFRKVSESWQAWILPHRSRKLPSSTTVTTGQETAGPAVAPVVFPGPGGPVDHQHRDHGPLQPAPPEAVFAEEDVDRTVQNMYRDLYHADGPRSDEVYQCLRVTLTDTSTDIILVAPTGMGKSVMFLGPAFVEASSGSTTLLITLYKVLHAQHFATARTMGIHAAQWTEGLAIAHAPALLILSIEDLLNARARGYLSSLGDKDALKRIVIDEAHLLLDEAEFRAKMHRVRDLRSVLPSVPFVLLTATLSPVLEKTLCDHLCVQRAFVRRLSSLRPTARLEVILCQNKIDMTERARDILRGAPDRPSSRTTRTIVYHQSVSDAVTFADDGNSYVYTGSMSDNERAENLLGWIAGAASKSNMSATSAFGVGVDYPDVATIIILGSYTCRSIVQQLGRGGRNGATYRVFFLHYHRQRLGNDVTTWIQSPGCLTSSLVEIVDGARCRPCILAENNTAAPRVSCGRCQPVQAPIAELVSPPSRLQLLSSAQPATAQPREQLPQLQQQTAPSSASTYSFLDDDIDMSRIDIDSLVASSTSSSVSSSSVSSSSAMLLQTVPSHHQPSHHQLHQPSHYQPSGPSHNQPSHNLNQKRTIVDPLQAPSKRARTSDECASLEIEVYQRLQVLKGACAVCLIESNKIVSAKKQHGCNAYASCFRCFSRDHQSTGCTFNHARSGGCFVCGLPARERQYFIGDQGANRDPFHPTPSVGWGVSCQYGVFRNVLLCAYDRRKINGPFRNIADVFETMDKDPHGMMAEFLRLVQHCI